MEGSTASKSAEARTARLENENMSSSMVDASAAGRPGTLQMEAGNFLPRPVRSCDGAVPDRFSGICEAPRKLLAQIGAVVELKAETPAGKAKKHPFWGAPGDESGSTVPTT